MADYGKYAGTDGDSTAAGYEDWIKLDSISNALPTGSDTYPGLPLGLGAVARVG